MFRHGDLVLGHSQATHADLRGATLVAKGLCCLLSPAVSGLCLPCPAVSPSTQRPPLGLSHRAKRYGPPIGVLGARLMDLSTLGARVMDPHKHLRC